MLKPFKQFGIIILILGFIGSASLNVGILSIASVGYAAAKVFEKVTGVPTNISELKKEKDFLAEKNNKLTAQKNKSDKQLKKAKLTNDDLKIKLNQKIDLIDERDIELNNLKSQKSVLQNQLDETAKKQLRLSNELDTKSDKLDQITEQFLKNESKISLLETDITEKNKKIALIDDQLKATQKSLDNAKPMDRTVLYRGKRVAVKAAIVDTNDRITKRISTMAYRNLTSIPAEAIPYLGIAVILSVTAYDLYDSCDTIKDLHELNVALDPSRKLSDDQTAICGMKVPSTDEVWEKVKQSPREVYIAASAYVPDLPEFNMPVWLSQILD